MLRRNYLLLPILFFSNALALDAASRSQTSPLSFNTAISQLAGRIADPLRQAQGAKIVFADLKGPNGESHPAGKWLAGRLADACENDFPDLEIIIRPKNEESGTVPDDNGNQKQRFKSVEEWARSIGANVVVVGTFGRLSDGIGISLSAMTSSDSPRSLAQTTGIVPVTDDITSLSAEPLPAFREVPRAGVAGFGIPVCLHCPPPEYTKKARAGKLTGSVVLEATITPDGHATNISIKRSFSADLDAQVIKAVSKWTFKPAIGPSGKPVSVIVPIEVTFRLY